jgi:hypothetical protein
MRTIAFIGSDKNAGKTTALNFVYRKLSNETSSPGTVCINSIGINGEESDYFDGKPKPSIELQPGSYFITTPEHISDFQNSFRLIEELNPPIFSRPYVLAQCTKSFSAIIEGPNCKSETAALKETIQSTLAVDYFLIDGSTDRQFLGDSAISDGFFFSLLLSEDREQLQRAHDLLYPLGIANCPQALRDSVTQHQQLSTKSMLFSQEHKLTYHSDEIPFLDNQLKAHCQQSSRDEQGVLYLNGALSRSLAGYLAPFEGLTIILDSFLLYQNIFSDSTRTIDFKPELYLLHPVNLLAIFTKLQAPHIDTHAEIMDMIEFPKEVPVYNLFVEEPAAFSI